MMSGDQAAAAHQPPEAPAQAPGTDRPTKLYRHFDADGRLLYVGITFSIMRRSHEHSLYAHWFDAIDNIKVETFPTREAAEQAERKAIIAERPLYNVAGRERERPPQEVIPSISICMCSVCAAASGAREPQYYSWQIDAAAIRQKLGLSCEEFAERFYLSARDIRKWESGIEITRQVVTLFRAIDADPEEAARRRAAEAKAQQLEGDDHRPRRRGRPTWYQFFQIVAPESATVSLYANSSVR